MKPFQSILCIIAVLCYTEFCNGQSKEIDSIQELLKTARDTTEVNLLRQQGVLLRSYDKNKALELLLESIEKSKKINYLDGEINGLYSLGLTHGMTGSYAESLEYLNKCLSLATQHQDFERMNYVYNSMGIVYRRIGDYPKSQSYYLKRIKLIDSLQLDQDTSSPYLNIGVLYGSMGQYDKAVESLNKSLVVFKGNESDRASLENVVLANLAGIDFEKKDYKAAVEKFLKVIDYDKKQNDNIELCAHYSNIASCYVELEQWQMANDYYLRALELAEQLSIKQEIAIAQYKLADLMFLQKKFNEALDYSTKSLRTLDSLDGYMEKREANEIAYKIHEAMGKPTQAIYHLNQTMAYGDSMYNETKVKEIQNLQVQHEVYLKDKEIKEGELQMALLNTEVSLNNKRLEYMTIITLLLLFSASLLYFRFLAKKKSNAELLDKNRVISHQNEVIESMNTQLEKRMLRAQMNPHFIFNSLNSIKHLINSNDKENALKYLSKFSKLLRQVLESSVNVNLVLKEEIELLKIYVELEALRFDNSFNYSFNIDENLDLYQNEVPMLLVQPYIENAIIHGLLPLEGPKHLQISFNDKSDHIECTIEDNGVGFNPKPSEGKEKRTSRGMSITEKRINALRKFSDQELIKIENLGNGDETGTRVTISIPKDQSTNQKVS
ncbi:tetratricopeptide repeat protein [Allomuricauda taeanensis]|jgi:tetratricopeptide (TPR) repeat protein|uniref:tetratricopeptide repeat-containing sensor histidine kinase n=1 Tax=Flagellimonas taeanensis TaxID=1005926 RepID=UPI002E7B41B2|nr:tetratricopeptide repeat protein [Allomuricauda taeanensis]MEE1963252.1 tetratricopeptide repeat protein [Allomuricauda taeanensis]